MFRARANRDVRACCHTAQLRGGDRTLAPRPEGGIQPVKDLSREGLLEAPPTFREQHFPRQRRKSAAETDVGPSRGPLSLKGGIPPRRKGLQRDFPVTTIRLKSPLKSHPVAQLRRTNSRPSLTPMFSARQAWDQPRASHRHPMRLQRAVSEFLAAVSSDQQRFDR